MFHCPVLLLLTKWETKGGLPPHKSMDSYLRIEAMYDIDQMVVKSYLQSKLKPQYQLISAYDPL